MIVGSVGQRNDCRIAAYTAADESAMLVDEFTGSKADGRTDCVCIGEGSVMKRLCCIAMVFTFMGLIVGCDRTESNWEKTKQLNTAKAYELYLKNYPQSPHNNEAKALFEILTDWEEAQKTNNSGAFFTFAEKYPDSELSRRAFEQATRLVIESEPLKAMDFNPPGVAKNGSITLVAVQGGTVVKTERPGEMMAFSMGGSTSGGGLGRPQLSTGNGSVIRLAGRGSEWSVPQGQRLCFKNTSDGWVLLCGSGILGLPFKAGSQAFGRSFSKCLVLSEHPEALVREGAARDLGRLSLGLSGPEMEKASAVLAKLLDDTSVDVRMGAFEGLGYLGVADSFTLLRSYAERKGIDLAKVQKNEDQNESTMLAEALSIIAGYRLIGKPEVKNALSIIEAGDLFIHASNWVLDCPICSRAAEDTSAAEKGLREASAVQNPRVRESVERIVKECMPTSADKLLKETLPPDTSKPRSKTGATSGKRTQ
jgi:hypothetical protein